MPKRGENIRKRKDGRWEGRYIISRKEDGRAIYKSVYGKSYAEVKGKMIALSCATKQNKETEKEKNLQFILEEWLKNGQIEYKQSTYQKYQYIIQRHIIPDIGEIKGSDIKAKTINDFLESKLQRGKIEDGEKLSASYVRTMGIILSAAIRYGTAEEFCPPLKSKIRKPTEQTSEVETLSHKDYSILVKHCTKKLNFTNLAILISLNTGLRIGEICALKWLDIDFANMLLRVNSTASRIQDEEHKCKWILDCPKTKASNRTIPISDKLAKYLLKMQKISKSEFVISEDKDFINPRTFEDHFHLELDNCGIASTNYHSLRHTYATRCVEAGMDIKTLSEILGHSSVAITLNTYVHSSMELKKTQVKKVEKFFEQ